MGQEKNSIFKRVRTSKREFFHEGGLGDLDLPSFILEWSIKYPIDRIWRNKYNIPFNSKSHQDVFIIDMLVDISQDHLYRSIKDIERVRPYSPGVGNYLKKAKVEKITQEEIEDAFESIEIDNLNYDEDNNLIL